MAAVVILALVHETLWKVTPVPIVRIAPALDKFIVDVPALNVRFVCVAKFTTPLARLNVTVLLPRLIVRATVLLDVRDAAVTLKLLVVKVPALTLMLPVIVKASDNDTVVDAVFGFIEQASVFPFVVTFTVPLKLN